MEIKVKPAWRNRYAAKKVQTVITQMLFWRCINLVEKSHSRLPPG